MPNANKVHIAQSLPGLTVRTFYHSSRHSSVEIDHEIFPTVILSLPLIQEGHVSVSGERMCLED